MTELLANGMSSSDVVGFLSREGVRLEGPCSAAYLDQVLGSAVELLRNAVAERDAALAADMGMAELGALVRRLRGSNDFLRREVLSLRAEVARALDRADELERMLAEAVEG